LYAATERSARADVVAPGAHERRNTLDELAGPRIDPDRRPAGVVAVEAIAVVEVDLAVLPRTEGERELGAHAAPAFASRVQRLIAAHVKAVRVVAQADDRAEPGSEIGPYLRVRRRRELVDVILAGGRQHHARLGVEEAVENVVVAALQPDQALEALA